MKNGYDNKQALKDVFNLEWESKELNTQIHNSNKRWSKEDRIKLVKLAAVGFSTYDIAVILGRTMLSVQLTLGEISKGIINNAPEK